MERPQGRSFDYTGFDQDEVLYCRISLAKDWKHELIGTRREHERVVPLDHKRDARTPRRYLKLAPGKSVQLALELAEGFFGKFSIPMFGMIENARTEGAKKRLVEDFALTRDKAILKWGDSPRPARYSTTMTYEALGPARMPDVTVTIIPAQEDDDTENDPRYAPTRLRTLYSLGDFFDAEHLVNPGGFMQKIAEDERQSQLDFARASTDTRLAQIEATNKVLMQLISTNPDLITKLQELTAGGAALVQAAADATGAPVKGKTK